MKSANAVKPLNDDDQCVSQAEISRRLEIDKGVVAFWIRNKFLPSFSLPGTNGNVIKRIRLTDFRAFLDKYKTEKDLPKPRRRRRRA